MTETDRIDALLHEGELRRVTTDPAELLNAVVSVSEGLDLDETLARIVESATTLVDAQYGALGVLGPDGKVSRFAYVGIDGNLRAQIGPLPHGAGLLGAITEHAQSVRVTDIASDHRSVGFPAGHPHMTSFLGVPITVGGNAFGNLYVTDKRGGDFTDEDEEILTALSLAAGVALTNALLYEISEQRQRWQQAVAEVDTLVLSETAPDVVGNAIVNLAREVSQAAVAVLAAPLVDGELRIVAVATMDDDTANATGSPWSVGRSRLTVAHHEQVRSIADCVGKPVAEDTSLARAFRSGSAQLSQRPMFATTELHLLGSCLAVPLAAGDGPMAVLGLSRFAGEEAFTDEDVTAAYYFARNTAVALSFAQVQRERSRLAIFEERDRIARDLHDLVIQRLFATGMMLQGSARMAELPPVIAARINRAVDELDDTIKEIRTTIFDLTEIDDDPSWVSVRARVLAEVERAGRTAAADNAAATRPSVTFTGPVDTSVDTELAAHLVAAVREGISNAMRHGQGKAVVVKVGVQDSKLELVVQDDGPGPPLGQLDRVSGLANLRERAKSQNGDCELLRRKSGGAELRWWATLRR